MFNSIVDNSIEIAKIMTNFKICATFFVSLILFLIAYDISKKPKVTKKRQEFKEVISPILAEVLVDGKIDIKNLILTTIVELQIKKNIAIVDDNTIELLHKDNLNFHELYLVDLIFQNKKLVTLDEINDRFSYAKLYEAKFENSMSTIAVEIQSKMYKMKLFSRRRTILLNFVSYIAMLIFINFPIILLWELSSKYIFYYIFSFIITAIASIVFFTRLTGGNTKQVMDSATNIAKDMGIYGVLSFIICITILYFAIIPKLQLNLGVIIAILINYFINFKTVKLAKNNVLSQKGFEERRKVLELKNFLEDYDLRKYENGEFYILWNEYFAYAAAFGIENSVILGIFSKWRKLDISFSFTKNLI